MKAEVKQELTDSSSQKQQKRKANSDVSFRVKKEPGTEQRSGSASYEEEASESERAQQKKRPFWRSDGRPCTWLVLNFDTNPKISGKYELRYDMCTRVDWRPFPVYFLDGEPSFALIRIVHGKLPSWAILETALLDDLGPDTLFAALTSSAAENPFDIREPWSVLLPDGEAVTQEEGPRVQDFSLEKAPLSMALLQRSPAFRKVICDHTHAPSHIARVAKVKEEIAVKQELADELSENGDAATAEWRDENRLVRRREILDIRALLHGVVSF